jgi:hypothetical protein
MRLNNAGYDQSTILEDRYKGDRFAGRGNQLIIDTALLMAEKHGNLPPGEAAKFAIAFKDINDTLANRQDKKLKGKQVLPSRLPDKIIGPKLIFGPGRKRALTGREIADQLIGMVWSGLVWSGLVWSGPSDQTRPDQILT